MHKFVNDKLIQYTTINENNLKLIMNKIKEIAEAEKQIISCIIRGDNKGIIFSDLNEAEKSFNEMKKIDRIAFLLRNDSGNPDVSEIEIIFDGTNENQSHVAVKGNNFYKVESVFDTLSPVFEQYRNKHKNFYSWWFVASIQILGVISIFLLSIWASRNVSTNSYFQLYTFIGVFLLFSNLWTFVMIGINNFIKNTFPKVQFKRKYDLSWLWQGMFLALFIWIIKVLSQQIYSFVTSSL